MSQQNNEKTKWVQPKGVNPFDALIERLEAIRDLLEEEQQRLDSELEDKDHG